MNFKLLLLIPVFSISMVFFPLYSSSQESISTPLVDKLSIEKKIGKLLILGFTDTSHTPQLKRHIDSIHPGGIIIYKRNFSKLDGLLELTGKLSKHISKPLLMVDQEGGLVSRIPGVHFASPLALASASDPDLVQKYAFHSGKILNALGIDLNLAPVLDFHHPTMPSFIGNRSFGSSPTVVTESALAFSKGLIQAGVTPVAKHFPTHGSILLDSHKTTPKIMSSEDELFSHDLIPYRYFSALSGTKAVLLSHVLFPKIDNLPPTFSKTIIQNLLREKLNFDGLVITDDLEMQGASYFKSIEERAVKSFLAGADMLMISWGYKRQKKVFNALLSAYKKGIISEDRINQSLKRIEKIKSNRTNHSLKIEYSSIKQIEFYNQTLFSTRVRDQLSDLKLDTYSIKKPLFLGRQYSYYRWFKKSLPDSKYVNLRTLSKDPLSLERYILRQGNKPIFYHITGNGSLNTLRKLSSKATQKLILINTLEPNRVKGIQSSKVVNLSSNYKRSGKYIADLFKKSFYPNAKSSMNAVRD